MNRQINVRLPIDLYADLKLLKTKLKLKDDSSAVRFAITYTVASIESLDEQHVSSALALAIGDLFRNGMDVPPHGNIRTVQK